MFSPWRRIDTIYELIKISKIWRKDNCGINVWGRASIQNRSPFTWRTHGLNGGYYDNSKTNWARNVTNWRRISTWEKFAFYHQRCHKLGKSSNDFSFWYWEERNRQSDKWTASTNKLYVLKSKTHARPNVYSHPNNLGPHW